MILINMAHIFRVDDAELMGRNGYSARYFADVIFNQKIDSAGFILVTIPSGFQTAPHTHMALEEVFFALTPLEVIVDDSVLSLRTGDLVIVGPNEIHSFQNKTQDEGLLLAIKFPNLKDDKFAVNR